MNFVNLWDADLAMPGEPSIKGFFQVKPFLRFIHSFTHSRHQPKFLNGTFNQTDPRHCSVNDPQKGTCFLNPANRDGFYEDAPIVVSILFCMHCFDGSDGRWDVVFAGSSFFVV